MTYLSNEEVEKRLDSAIRIFNDGQPPLYTFSREEILKNTILKIRLSDLDAHIEKVEGMKVAIKDSHEFGAGQYTAFDDILTYLNSLKQK